MHDLPTPLRFLFGTASVCTATMFTHPLDVVKVNMQLQGEGGARAAHSNSFYAARAILRTNGLVRGLYAGCSASLLRQCSYGTARLGIYGVLFDHFSADPTFSEAGKPPPFILKAAIGAAAGSLGSIIGTPFDLALVRMAADKRLPEAERRNYKNGFDAVRTVASDEGVGALWRGCLPTVSRCVVLNISQLAVYSEAKEFVQRGLMLEDGLLVRVLSALVSGLASTTASVPLDTAKTRIQQSRGGQYSGMLDCLAKTVRNEGVTSLWKGWTPAYARLGPHTLITLVTLDSLKAAWSQRREP